MLTVIFALAINLTSCDDDAPYEDEYGFIHYLDYNLKFRLPNYFRKRSVQGMEIMYSTTGATFEVQVMPEEEILDPEYQYEFDFDITVEEYAEFFIDENGWSCEYKYDPERNTANMTFFWTPSEEIGYGYYNITILKNENALFCAVFSCSESEYENYGPLFREWASYLEVVSPD